MHGVGLWQGCCERWHHGFGTVIEQASQVMAAAAAPWFKARPSSCAPVSRVIAVLANKLPFMTELTPKVIALPADQKRCALWHRH
jgi:hypothetical protein